MDLAWIELRFKRRIDEAEAHLSDFLAGTGPALSERQLYELEGWLSNLWQTWGRFCRHTVFASCTGCNTRTGTVVAATHPSEGVVSFIACRQSKGVAPTNPGMNSTLRKEPTWGDVDKLIEVIQALNPPNAAVLQGAFGTIPEITHVQRVRNASAHRNAQAFAEVIAFQSQYLATPIRHPLQALFWVDAATGQTLIRSRLDDMRLGAQNACT